MIKTFYYGRDPDEAVFGREQPLSRDVSDTVREIITDVARRGDDALRDYTEKFDGVRLSDIEVSREEMSEALGKVDSGLLGVFHRAAENITRFHSEQVRKGFELKDGGITLGQKVTPLARVGLYVPGGTAAYPSTVLMNVIPAKIAGCGEIIITTPPGRDGKVNPNVLAAAAVAGADRIFKAGGAQAIAALAYGTETVPAVDKITGPGNAYVAEAKRQVFGMVSIDMIAGPSEILVIADGENDPKVIAADLLSQAEHDKNAMSVLVTDSEELAALVTCEIEDELSRLSREEIARASIDKNGRIIIVKDMAEAVKVSDRIAPEHLELCVADPFGLLGSVGNAGSVFLGRYCPEALGDYMAGPNHTLPTSGTARFSSPLSVDDFVKKTQYCYFDRDSFLGIGDDVRRFAECEGLTAHAESAKARMKK